MEEVGFNALQKMLDRTGLQGSTPPFGGGFYRPLPSEQCQSTVRPLLASPSILLAWWAVIDAEAWSAIA